MPVSIHASAWEATRLIGHVPEQPLVSIHASAWEATSAARGFCPSAFCFNPRLRVGGDQITKSSLFHHLSFNPRLRVGGDTGHQDSRQGFRQVSIHASAWEATRSWPPH